MQLLIKKVDKIKLHYASPQTPGGGLLIFLTKKSPLFKVFKPTSGGVGAFNE